MKFIFPNIRSFHHSKHIEPNSLSVMASNSLSGHAFAFDILFWKIKTDILGKQNAQVENSQSDDGYVNYIEHNEKSIYSKACSHRVCFIN